MRTQSHFVEMNSKNEDLLLEEMTEPEKLSIDKMDKMLLDDEENTGTAHDDDELLIWIWFSDINADAFF